MFRIAVLASLLLAWTASAAVLVAAPPEKSPAMEKKADNAPVEQRPSWDKNRMQSSKTFDYDYVKDDRPAPIKEKKLRNTATPQRLAASVAGGTFMLLVLGLGNF